MLSIADSTLFNYCTCALHNPLIYVIEYVTESTTAVSPSSSTAVKKISYQRYRGFVIPENVVTCGPIILSSASAAQVDPELALWLKKAPTVMVNLGSHTEYDESAAIEMAKGVKILLDNTKVQVLWKFNKKVVWKSDKRGKSDFSDAWQDILADEIKSRRVILSNWIKADPAALLATGDIIVSVHHGGANCFHEAVGMGIPHVILPMWFDLYDFAVRAEYLGIGVWGNRKVAPYWAGDELGAAFLRVAGDGEEAVAMRKKAADVSKSFKARPGKSVAAQEISKLARIPANAFEDKPASEL